MAVTKEASMVELSQTATTRADMSTTWRILTDHAGTAGWSSQVFRSRLGKPGVPAPNGVGAGNTRITWTIRFDPRPARLAAVIELIARLSTSRFAADLARAADEAGASA